MLSFMTPPSPAPDLYTTTMSLAILPSAAPMTCCSPRPLSPLINGPSGSTGVSTTTLPTIAIPKASKRPKLSLNTSDATTMFGKKSTSLRLETLSATSPTTLNTFSNGYAAAQASSSSMTASSSSAEKGATVGNAAGRPQLSISTALTVATTAEPRTPEPIEHGNDDGTTRLEAQSSPYSDASSSASLSPPRLVPYKASFGVTSILRNGPLPRATSIARYRSNARPMFPIAKKVSFRAPLTEEVVNKHYTAAHSDLDSPSSRSSTTTLIMPAPAMQLPQDTDASSVSSVSPPPSLSSSTESLSPADSYQIGSKRESDDEASPGSCPQTPIAGRRKRVRDWHWTLGPIDGVSQQ